MPLPSIKVISCVSSSSYLIDFEGNLWSFGLNEYGQLGHGDTTNINTPKVILTLKDIHQYHMEIVENIFFPKTLKIILKFGQQVIKRTWHIFLC